MWACNINSSYQDICIAGWSKPLLTSWDPCHIMVSLLVSGMTYTTGQHLVAIVKVSMVYPLNNTDSIFAFLFLLELLRECSSPRMKALCFFLLIWLPNLHHGHRHSCHLSSVFKKYPSTLWMLEPMHCSKYLWDL